MTHRTTSQQTHRPQPLSLASRNSRQQTFSAGVQRYGQLFTLAQRGYIDLGSTVDTAPVYLPPVLLDTHVMIQAPTGHGKTYLSRAIFRALAPQRVSILVDDPKHDYLCDLEEDCAALKLDDRVTIFDSSDLSRAPVWNPLKKNGVAIDDHTSWMLSAIRACFRQDDFDNQPQRRRWLTNAILPVIERDGSFHDVLDLLNFQHSEIRREVIEYSENKLVRQEWAAYQELSITRRRDETYSAYGWLRRFCENHTFRQIFMPHEHSFDLGACIKNAGILLSSFPRYRPLDADVVSFMRSILLQFVLAYGFHIPVGERPPLYIFLDEAEHALERDTGVIETILNEGRSLGIRLILLFHNFAQVAKSNPALLESCLTNCRTKIIGGHLTQANLDILTGELFVNEWHPHIIRDQITSLEVEPCETTRIVRTITRNRSKERGMSYPFVETEGTSTSQTEGFSTGTAQGTQETRGTFHGHTTGTNVADGQTQSATTGRSHTASLGTSDTHMKGYSHQSGQGQGHGTMDASGTGRMSAEGEGTSLSWDPYSLAIMPTAMTTAEHETTGTSSNAVHAESAHTQSSISEGWNEADASTTSSTDSDTTSEAETSGTSHVEGTSQAESVGETFAYGTSTNQSEERSTSTTTGENYSVSRGVTPSESTSEGESIAESVTPFHELKKRWRVASREFLSLADFLTTKLIQLKSQPKMHWAIQPPEGKTVFFKARFVKPLAGGRERLSAFRDRVFSKPYYSTHTEVMTEPRAATETIQAADAAHVLMLTTRPHGALPFPTPRDESDDEDFDAWGTEKPAL